MANIEKDRMSEITELHNEIEDHLRSSLEKAIRIGELLTDQKTTLEHGEFTPWIKVSLPFTDRTARNYMKLYRERDRLKTEAVSDLKSAYKLLAAPKAATGKKWGAFPDGYFDSIRDAINETDNTEDMVRVYNDVRELAQLQAEAEGKLSELRDTEQIDLLEDEDESDEGSLLDLEPNELKQIIRDINEVIEDKRYYVSEDDAWWSNTGGRLGDDGSMTPKGKKSASLAFNIMKHWCYFRHLMWHNGNGTLPAGIITYFESFDEDLTVEPKLMCGEFCRQEW